eukprot:gene10167-2587_t
MEEVNNLIKQIQTKIINKGEITWEEDILKLVLNIKNVEIEVINERFSFFQKVLEIIIQYGFVETNYDEEKLFYLIKFFLEFKDKEILSFIQSKYLSFIISTLFKIIENSNKITNTTELNENSTPQNFVTTNESYQKVLNQIFNETAEYFIFQALIKIKSDKKISKKMKSKCGVYLNFTLYRPNGVFSLLNLFSLIEEDTNHFRMLSVFIQNNENHYKNIFPQLIKILRFGKNAVVKRNAILCIGKLIEENVDLSKIYFIEDVLKPLISKSQDENEITQSIEEIHQIISGNPLIYQIYDSLDFIIPQIFQLYCFVCQTVYNVKHSCEEIVSNYFKYCHNPLNVIKKLIFFREDAYVFKSGESGGVIIEKVSKNERNYLWEGECIVNILKLTKNDNIAGDLFLFLISKLSVIKKQEEISEDNVLMLNLIQLMIEQLKIQILKNAHHTIQLVKYLLLADEEDEDSITMGLAILTTLISGGISIEKEEEGDLFELLDIVERFCQSNEVQISEMASNLVLSIKHYKKHDNPLINILKDLKDPIIAIRSFGIYKLRKLIELKDPIIQENFTDIVNLFESQLKHEDTYVYLGAIQAFIALGDKYPNQILPILTKYYCDKNYKERLKIGEVLLKIAQKSGEILFKYAHFYVDTFLECSREENEIVRASSLSNIAMFCQVIRFGIHPYINQIFDFTIQLIQTEKSIIVKRSCLQVFSKLIHCIDEEIFHEIDMKKLVQILKNIQYFDKSLEIVENSKILLNEIEEFARNFLGTEEPKSTLKFL